MPKSLNFPLCSASKTLWKIFCTFFFRSFKKKKKIHNDSIPSQLNMSHHLLVCERENEKSVKSPIPTAVVYVTVCACVYVCAFSFPIREPILWVCKQIGWSSARTTFYMVFFLVRISCVQRMPCYFTFTWMCACICCDCAHWPQSAHETPANDDSAVTAAMSEKKKQ